jgi:hypothetical protein
MSTIQAGFRFVPIAVLAAILGLAGSAAAQTDADFQNVWVHYDYMVFPKGWTSLAGVTYPDGLSMAPSPEAIDKVVDAFAAQGLTLHIDPEHNAIPGHQVLIPDFLPGWSNPGQACVGPDAVSFLKLKNRYFRPLGNHPWHYAIFAFNAGLPDTGVGSLCPADLTAGPTAFPDPFASGMSELPGFNFVVSFGADLDQGFINDLNDYRVGGTFMHELGHNFGLEHGGVIMQFGVLSAEVYLTNKPNYISVMNYSYQNGILFAASLGSTMPIGKRLDYSNAELAPLNEADLDEFVGVNAGTTDIVINWNSRPPCNGFALGPAQGPIDWNCDGALELHAAGDLDNDNGSPNSTLHGFDDWSYIKQQLQLPPDVIESGLKRIQYEEPARDPLSSSPEIKLPN